MMQLQEPYMEEPTWKSALGRLYLEECICPMYHFQHS